MMHRRSLAIRFALAATTLVAFGAPALSSASAATRATPTIAYWKFDAPPDATGAYKDSVHGLKATVFQVGTGGTIEYKPGVAPLAPRLAGNKGSIFLTPSGVQGPDRQYTNGKGLAVHGLSLGNGAYTVEFFAQMSMLDGRTTNAIPIAYGPLDAPTATKSQFYLQHSAGFAGADTNVGSTESIIYYSADGVGHSTAANSHFSDGGWHHIAFVYEDVSPTTGRLSYFIDGQPSGSVSSATRTLVDGELKIGFYSASTAPPLAAVAIFPGGIDELRISRVALSPKQFLNAP